MNPLVSIIIPTYNRAHLISETLRSVELQSYTNWECIIVDDGSSDQTVKVVQDFIGRDSRFKFIKRPEYRVAGGNAARNYGFQLSNGKYINWLDSDDLISTNKLELQVALLENTDATLKVATCKWGIFKSTDDKIDLIENLEVYKSYHDKIAFFQDLFRQFGYFPPHTYLVSRELVNVSGLWNENLTINQDGEFFIRVLCNTLEIAFESHSYVLYRETRIDSTSLLNNEKISDYYNSWKMIEAYLNMKFGIGVISNFRKIKDKAFQRIPKEMASIYLTDSVFFHDQLIARRTKQKWSNRFIRLIKSKFSKSKI